MAKTIYSAALDWLDHLHRKEYKDHTVTVYGREIKKMYEYYGAYRHVTSITPKGVEMFLKSNPLLKGAKDQPLAKQTIDRTIRVYKHFLIWARKTGLIESNPWPKDQANGLV